MPEKHTWAQVADVIEDAIAFRYSQPRPLNEAYWDAYAWITSRHFAAAELIRTSTDKDERDIQAEIFEESKIPLAGIQAKNWGPLQKLLRKEALLLARSGGQFSGGEDYRIARIDEITKDAKLDDLRTARGFRNLALSLGES